MTADFLVITVVVNKFAGMGKKVKEKNISDQPKEMELLAIKMAVEIYPEIMRMMKDLNDRRVEGVFGNMEVIFTLYEERNGLEIKGDRPKTTTSYASQGLWVIDDGKQAEVCPVFEKFRHSSSDYMDMCEASVCVLEDLRKGKLRITQIVERIDALPNVLSRVLLTEKYKQ